MSIFTSLGKGFAVVLFIVLGVMLYTLVVPTFKRNLIDNAIQGAQNKPMVRIATIFTYDNANEKRDYEGWIEARETFYASSNNGFTLDDYSRRMHIFIVPADSIVVSKSKNYKGKKMIFRWGNMPLNEESNQDRYLLRNNKNTSFKLYYRYKNILNTFVECRGSAPKEQLIEELINICDSLILKEHEPS